jgi:hypothetical protein
MWDEIAITFVACILTLLIVTLYVLFRLNEPMDLPANKLIISKEPSSSGKGISYDDLISRFRTGDLLAVSYNSFRGKLVRIFTGSMWTHIGMIYRTPDFIGVLEMARYPERKGILKTPIHFWLDWNEDRIFAWKPYTGPEICTDHIDDIFNAIQPGEADMFVGSWLRAMIKQSYRPQPKKKKFYCSELVSYFLQELGMMEKIHLPSGYPPKELLFGHPPFRSGYTYAAPILLTPADTN